MPLSILPDKIYLDTCIISGLVKLDLNSTDINSINKILNYSKSHNITICASTVA